MRRSDPSGQVGAPLDHQPIISPPPPPLQVEIQGPVLLLMGPIGLFFSRFWHYLHGCGVPAYKISFPLHEFGFPPSSRIAFAAGMEEWPGFLRAQIQEKGIRHLFMYGDFIDPHRLAIEEARRLGIDAYVFELGYVRPNFVTLELERVNARSHLNKPVDFYRSLPPVARLPVIRLEPGWRWRKIWKAPTFVQHAFTRYRIIQGEHKLQPSPRYLWCQLRGAWRTWLYRYQERALKKRLLENLSYFLAVLQVSSDSQITMGSGYRGMHDFIEDVIVSFAAYSHSSDHLAFKHHPRDRGYNNYKKLIDFLAAREGVALRVHYFHDGPLSAFLRTCRGVVTVNSTVGLQALYHAVPIKVLGQTFYDLPGLTDQQGLDRFWLSPQPSDRDLFYRFYNHLVTTTQVNGNFDGEFPFRQTFPIASAARILTPPRLHPTRNGLGPFPGQRPLRLLRRSGWFVVGVALYWLQWLVLLMGFRAAARRLLSASSTAALHVLGITVIVDDSQPPEEKDRPQIHLYNHASPFDVLAIQSALRIPSITTASLHLGRFLPGFQRSAANAGHVLIDHRQMTSRLAGLQQASEVLAEHGQLLVAPNGSLRTPVTRRASPSAFLLAQRHGAVIVPWRFEYQGMDNVPDHWLYQPLALLRWRLLATESTLHCRRGRSCELPLPEDPRDGQAFSQLVIDYYRRVGAEPLSLESQADVVASEAEGILDRKS